MSKTSDQPAQPRQVRGWDFIAPSALPSAGFCHFSSLPDLWEHWEHCNCNIALVSWFGAGTSPTSLLPQRFLSAITTVPCLTVTWVFPRAAQPAQKKQTLYTQVLC